MVTEIPTLPVWRTAMVVWLLPFVHWRDLLRVLWLPFLLIAAAQAIEFWAGREADPQAASTLLRIPLNFLATIVATALSMAVWHRVLFPHPPLPDGLFPIRPGRAIGLYLVYWLVLAFVLLVAWSWGLTLFSGGVEDLRSFVLWRLGAYVPLIAMLYPLLRLGLLLPAAAHDERPDLSAAWRRSMGNGWRLVGIGVLTVLPLNILASLMPWLIPVALVTVVPPEAVWVLYGAASITATLLSAILAASLLSVAYRYLTLPQEAAPGDGAAAQRQAGHEYDASGLPVWQTVVDSFQFLFVNWRSALRVGWVAVLVTFAVDLLFDLPAGFGEPSVPQHFIFGYLEMLAYIPAIAATVVPWHRLILLKEGTAGARLGRRGRSYILRVALLYTIFWAAIWLAYSPLLVVDGHQAAGGHTVNPLVVLAGYFYWIGSLAASVGFVLLSPILPAVAVDQYQGVKRAFDLSRGKRLRLIVISFAVLLPSYLVLQIIVGLAGEAFDGYGAYLRDAVYAVNFVFEALIAATALSLCYHRMGGMGEATPPATTET